MSSLSSRMDVIKEPDGSYSIALRARRCCWMTSWSRQELLASSISEGSGLEDHTNVSLVDELWAIRACRQAFNGFRVAITRFRQTYNDTLRCSILKRMSKIHQLLCIRQIRSAMNWDRDLLPKGPPVMMFPSNLGTSNLGSLTPLPRTEWGWNRLKGTTRWE